ncbi:UNKNOWN [Stylonychia lemnae]|uniref:Uncharacterized protein n=1 Tax=Stylonychia lemnae TaxID=5949 RepID=A0A078APQ8_STYLE|nr:UNKNOWN [Stylonychia lemnae]|eukprot:CDW84154.1 UNKNOWN [Stylonychia lemnae]
MKQSVLQKVSESYKDVHDLNTKATKDSQPLLKYKIDLDTDHLEKYLKSIQSLQIQQAKALNQVIEKLESDDDRQGELMLHLDKIEKRIEGTQDLRVKIMVIENELEKHQAKLKNFEEIEFDTKMNQRLQEPLEKIQMLEDEVALMDQQYITEDNNLSKNLNAIENISMRPDQQNEDGMGFEMKKTFDMSQLGNNQNQESDFKPKKMAGFHRQMTKMSVVQRRQFGTDPFEAVKQMLEKRVEDLEKAVYIYGIGEEKNNLQNDGFTPGSVKSQKNNLQGDSAQKNKLKFDFRKNAAEKLLFSGDNQQNLSPQQRAKLREQILERVLHMNPQKLNENLVVELYSKYKLMNAEVQLYNEFFEKLTSKELDVSDMGQFQDKMRRVGISLVGDVEQLKDDCSSVKFVEDKLEFNKRVQQLKRELLIDLNLNKDLVRNYELAARRLENVLIHKIDAEKIKEFDKVLKDDVKDFLSLTSTGKKLQDLDFKVNQFNAQLNEMMILVGNKNSDLDDSGVKDNLNISEKFKSIEARLQDIYSFYNRYQRKFSMTNGQDDFRSSSEEDSNYNQRKLHDKHRSMQVLTNKEDSMGISQKSPPQSPGRRKKKGSGYEKRISILNVQPSTGKLSKLSELDDLKEYVKGLEFKLNGFMMKVEENFQNDFGSDGEEYLHKPNSNSPQNSKEDLTQIGAKQKQISQEVMQIRNQMSKHQIQIARLDQELTRQDQQRQAHDFDKIYKTVQENYELLKRYIDEVNSYSKDFYERIQSRLNFKADTDFFQKHQSNVEEKIVSELNRKIDKLELKRAHNAIRRKLDKLEDKVIDLKNNPRGRDQVGPVALSNTNKKCISCYRDMNEELQYLQMTPQKPSTSMQTERGPQTQVFNPLNSGSVMIPFTNVPLTNKYLFRELAQKGRKYGLGFSRILNKIQPNQIEEIQVGFMTHRGLVGSLSRQELQARASIPRQLDTNLHQNQIFDAQDIRGSIRESGSMERKISLKLPTPKNTTPNLQQQQQVLNNSGKISVQNNYRSIKSPSQNVLIKSQQLANSRIGLQTSSQQTIATSTHLL